jgi:SAM-dependent methyltransferase
MSQDLVYIGKDLEAMSFAKNYHEWILSVFSKYLGGRIVEVGAGSGSFSELLLERSPESLDLVEPSADMFQLLEQRLQQVQRPTNINFHNATFVRVADELRNSRRPDSILYVNVLEHIEDDTGELQRVYQTLEPRGRLFIFVPAFEWLLGGFDKKIGHFRRYTRSELQKKTETAGFKVIESRYFDFIGVFPWWVKYRLLKSDSLQPGAVKLYDQVAVPICRVLEGLVRPPMGKNLLLIAEKNGS